MRLTRTLLAIWLTAQAPGCAGRPRETGTAADSARPVAMPMVVATAWVDTMATPAPQPPDTLPLHPTPNGDRLPRYALGVLDRLSAGLTPAEWIRLRPRDTLDTLEPEYNRRYSTALFDSDWCVRARRRTSLADGRVALETAFFHVPPRSPAAELPAVLEARGREMEVCRLGAVRIESSVESEAEGDSLALALRGALATRRGPGEYDREYDNWRARYWTESSRWAVGDTIVFTTHDRLRDEVLAVAWLPSSGIALDFPDWRPAGEMEIAELQRLLSANDLSGELVERLLSLTDLTGRIYASDSWSDWSDTALIDALAPWLEQAERLPARRRAAALFLADRVMSAATGLSAAHGRDGTAVRERLGELGAEFGLAPITHEYHYEGNWLWEAYELDRDGPVGRKAFVLLLRYGFDTRTACAGGAELFVNVIREGERFLGAVATGDVEPELLGEVHRLLAEAYGDIIALERPVSESLYVDVDKYRDLIPGAREKAVAHYQRSLDLARDETTADALWQAGWRLAVGLYPVTTHFVCVYD